MEINKECEIIMLPTKLKSHLQKNELNELYNLSYKENSNQGYVAQHLYFTPNEEIKAGFSGKAIVTVKDDTRIKYLVDVIVSETNQCYCNEDRKFPYEFYSVKPIIVSTDESLGLQMPEKSFITFFVREYNFHNIIKKVFVKYTKPTYEDWIGNGGSPVLSTIVVNSDNTVDVILNKDSWNREEHCTDMQYYMEYCLANGYVTPMKWLDELKHY